MLRLNLGMYSSSTLSKASFNTSYVAVERMCPFYSLLSRYVSIHLMLRLNAINKTRKNMSYESFNTSYVAVELYWHI